jgi:hypothetical protein
MQAILAVSLGQRETRAYASDPGGKGAAEPSDGVSNSLEFTKQIYVNLS